MKILNLILSLILYVVYVCSLLAIGAGIVISDLYDSIPDLPYCYWEWFGMFSPALTNLL